MNTMTDRNGKTVTQFDEVNVEPDADNIATQAFTGTVKSIRKDTDGSLLALVTDGDGNGFEFQSHEIEASE